MTAVPSKTLPGGDELPQLGFGTWLLHDKELDDALRAALDAGYRHIDTADAYENDAQIGEIIAGYDRETLFLTTKVGPPDLGYESVIRSCHASLDRLGTDYLDLYLVHFPNPAISLRETLSAMAMLHEEGLVRNVGVSNFDRYRLSCAQHISPVPIAVNQIEFHPLFRQPRLVEYCNETDVVIEAAAPLGRGEVFTDDVVASIATKHDRSNAQVVLRWAIESGVVPLPRSSNPDHVRENFDLFDWSLDPDDIRLLDDHPRDEPVYTMPTAHWQDDRYGIAR